MQEGYTVFANAEASGTKTVGIADDANARMRAAGVHVLSMFAVVCELMRDWRNTPGSLELLPFFDQCVSAFDSGVIPRLMVVQVLFLVRVPCAWPCCRYQPRNDSSGRI